MEKLAFAIKLNFEVIQSARSVLMVQRRGAFPYLATARGLVGLPSVEKKKKKIGRKIRRRKRKIK